MKIPEKKLLGLDLQVSQPKADNDKRLREKEEELVGRRPWSRCSL